MAQNFALEAVARQHSGKGAARRARREQNHIPAVVYGAGKEPSHIALEHNQVVNALENEAYFSHILNLSIDGKKEKVVLKALQRHPFKPVIMHMDFQRIKADEKLHMHVPLHFINENKAPGLKTGGVISHHMSDIEVTCLPDSLPEFIELDVGHLDIGVNVHLSEVKLPKGVEATAIAHDQDPIVISMHAPRIQEEVEEEETGAPTPVETVITSEVAAQERQQKNEK